MPMTESAGRNESSDDPSKKSDARLEFSNVQQSRPSLTFCYFLGGVSLGGIIGATCSYTGPKGYPETFMAAFALMFGMVGLIVGIFHSRWLKARR
jgi:hypothetical protein